MRTLQGLEPNAARRVALEHLANELLARGLEGVEPEDDFGGWDPADDEPPATSWDAKGWTP